MLYCFKYKFSLMNYWCVWCELYQGYYTISHFTVGASTSKYDLCISSHVFYIFVMTYNFNTTYFVMKSDFVCGEGFSVGSDNVDFINDYS